MLLEGQVAVITGASRGLGAAIARRFVREGAALSLAARNIEALDTVAAEIEGLGGTALATRCDVTDHADVEALLTSTRDRYGRADIVLNNAGALVLSSFLDETEEQWQQMLDVNLTGARRVTKAFLPGMLDQGSGKIIFISSNTAKQGFPDHPGYAAAKAGLMALTKLLGREYGKSGIRVHALLPGLVADTDMGAAVVDNYVVNAFDGDPEKFWDWVNPLSPTGFHPTTEQIVDVVTFLATPAADVLHGTCITADHGFTPY